MSEGAGCTFTNGRVILAGYQPRKKIPIITGLGGKKEGNEELIYTAWRETLEELFDIPEVPLSIIKKCIEKIPERVYESKGYVQYIYNFSVLEEVMKFCKEQGMKSFVYKEFPTTIQELVLERIIPIDCVPEVSVLTLLPLAGQLVAKHFLKDIQMIRGDTSTSNDLCICDE